MVSPHPESSSALLHFLRFALHFYVDSHTRSYTDKHRQLEEKVSRPRWTTVDESGPNNWYLLCRVGGGFEFAVNRKAPGSGVSIKLTAHPRISCVPVAPLFIPEYFSGATTIPRPCPNLGRSKILASASRYRNLSQQYSVSCRGRCLAWHCGRQGRSFYPVLSPYYHRLPSNHYASARFKGLKLVCTRFAS